MTHMDFAEIWQSTLIAQQKHLWFLLSAVYERHPSIGLESQFAALCWCNMQPSNLALSSSYFPMLCEKIEDIIYTWQLLSTTHHVNKHITTLVVNMVNHIAKCNQGSGIRVIIILVCKWNCLYIKCTFVLINSMCKCNTTLCVYEVW